MGTMDLTDREDEYAGVQQGGDSVPAQNTLRGGVRYAEHRAPTHETFTHGSSTVTSITKYDMRS